MTPIRLTVGASASSKEQLLADLVDKASQFFGSEPFRMLDEVDAEAEVEVRSVAQSRRSIEVSYWTGQATFTNSFE